MAHTHGTDSTYTSGNTSPITFAFTTNAGDTVLTLSLKVVGGTNRAGGAPTFNGVALTQVNSTQKAATSPEASAELWFLVDPPIGNFTVSIPNTGTLTIFHQVVTGRAGSGKTSALDVSTGANGTSTNPAPGSVTPTVNGGFGVAVVATGAQSWSPSAQVGTAVTNSDDGAHGTGIQYHLQATAAAVNLGWTFGTSDDWGAVVAYFKEINSPNVTVGLTGIAVTCAAGTLGVAAAIALTGIAATGSAGTAAPTISKAITGEAVAGSPGTVGPSPSVPISGISATGAAGTMTASTDAPGDPYQISHGIGSPSSIPRFILVGLAPDGGGGDVEVALTGIAATASAGSVGPQTDVAASGESSAGSAGLVTPSNVVPIGGETSTAAAGSLSPDLARELFGEVSAGAAGSVVPALALTLDGEESASASGDVAAGTSASLSGVSGTGAAGDVVQSRTVPLSGEQSASGVGTVATDSDVVDVLTGVESVGSAGSMMPSTDSTLALTGVQVSGSAGNLGVERSTALEGISATAEAGSPGVTVDRAITGAQSTGAAGTVLTGNDGTAALTGIQSAGSVGSMTPSISVALDGEAGAGDPGAVTPSTTVPLTGASSTGRAGTLGPPPTFDVLVVSQKSIRVSTVVKTIRTNTVDKSII